MPLQGQRMVSTILHIPTYRVINDIGALAVGDRFDPISKRFFTVIDEVPCAVLLGQGQFLGRAGRGNNCSAQ